MLQKKVLNKSGSYSLAELIVLWPINLQNWFNWIASANDANIVNKYSPITCIKPVLDDTRHLWLWKIGQLSYSCHGVSFSKIKTYFNIRGACISRSSRKLSNNWEYSKMFESLIRATLRDYLTSWNCKTMGQCGPLIWMTMDEYFPGKLTSYRHVFLSRSLSGALSGPTIMSKVAKSTGEARGKYG